MLKIKKETPQKVELRVEVSKDLQKELTTYLKVGKFHKNFDKSVSINDIIEVCLSQLVDEEGYKNLLKEYEVEMEKKREKDRIRKKKVVTDKVETIKTVHQNNKSKK